MYAACFLSVRSRQKVLYHVHLPHHEIHTRLCLDISENATVVCECVSGRYLLFMFLYKLAYHRYLSWMLM